MFIRHGDISFHKINKMPKGETIKHKGEYIAALGEATGHAHRVKVAEPQKMQIIKGADGKIYINFLEDGQITHEEHKQITIKKGFYMIEHEREFDWFGLATRKVID